MLRDRAQSLDPRLVLAEPWRRTRWRIPCPAPCPGHIIETPSIAGSNPRSQTEPATRISWPPFGSILQRLVSIS